MGHPTIDLFRPLLRCRTKDEAISYLLKHPVLVSPYYTTLLQDWAATLASPERERAKQTIALKLEVFEQTRAGKYRVPLPNQILDLATKVAEGRYTLQYAQQVASQPEFFVELMYPTITSTLEAAEKLMIKDWRPAVTLMQIVFAALDARGKVIPENQQAMEVTTVETWLTVARMACMDVPDGRIFRDAVARAEPFADLEAGADPPAPILHRLGTFHLDVYGAGRSHANIEQWISASRWRLSEEYGDQLAGVPQNELEMPPISEAIEKAVGYFRRAAARRTGEARGRTLKALTQALTWLQSLDLPFDSKECASAAREALNLLPVDNFPAEHAELNRIIKNLQQGSAESSSEAVARARKILKKPIDKWLEEKDVIYTIGTFEQTAGAVSDADPKLALELWMAVDSLVRSQPEARRKAHDHELLSFAIRAFASREPKADGTPLGPKMQTLFQSAKRGSWPNQKVIYSMLRLASSTTTTGQEGEGLEALAYCADLASHSSPDPVLRRALPYLRALLETGHAVNGVNARQFGEAARRYLNAVGSNLEAGQPLAALDIVRRLLDLSVPGKPEANSALEALIASLAGNALRLELDADNAATTLIQFACRFAMSILLAFGPPQATVLLFVLDAAKGRRFRAALAEPGAALAWLNHPRTRALEDEMLRLSGQAALEAPADGVLLDQNMLLTAHVSPSEMQGGGTATEQLRNLRIRFDTGLDRQLSSGHDDGWSPDIEKLQSLLDDKVVLVLQYIGGNPQGVLTLTVQLISNDDFSRGQTVFPVTMSGSAGQKPEEKFTADTLRFSVSRLRDQVVSPPGPRDADSRALEALEADYKVFLDDPVGAKLKEFRAAGKNHLCMSPHGPLHFYPFHLLGPEEQPLARDWCVTYLPHPRLLDREQAPPDGRVELTSIGRDFAVSNEFHLPELVGSEDAARAISEVYPQARLLLGSAATEKAVLKALTGSRRVHISTHGLHNVSAPSFQCLFVQPEPPDDGIIHAFELLRLDLRGLDLVTFAACETALGRFDVADNLRGIPAALLIAGVSTIIGTLWNVEAKTAARFFTAFYQILKEQGSKKQAFYEAQSLTRREYPKYWDWGAFQFIGRW
jgi:CHAT domain